MTAARHLRVVDSDGEVLETSTPEETIHALQAALSRAQKTIDGLNLQLTDQRAKARKTHPIDEAFDTWKAALVAAGMKGKAKCKLGPSRIDGMARMFDAGYTLEDFRLASVGVAAWPYFVYGKRCAQGKAKDVDVDLATLCKEEKRLEEAVRVGYLVEKSRRESIHDGE